MNALSRREFLWKSGGGLGGIALASLLMREAKGATIHHPARAKRVIQLFMAGAASHIDLFDEKPALVAKDGQPWDPGEAVELFQSTPGHTFAAPWKWASYGETGKRLSEIAAPLGTVVDDMAFVHSMTTRTGVHSTGTLLQATGFQIPGFPGMGAWVSYGLGSMNENLPAYVVLPDHRGFPSNGQKNWDSAFLPAEHQGTVIRPGSPRPMEHLAADDPAFADPRAEQEGLRAMALLNGRHAEAREDDSRLRSRIRSYELAARMQLAAPEVLDISGEPAYVLKEYGLDRDPGSFPREINAPEEAYHFGLKCLIARRLLERGVRFVQIWMGCDNGFPRRNWDSHEELERDHGALGPGMAHGAAALIRDLKRRGMLEDTIVHWTTEFGRMPCAQGGRGRDHNPFCFTNWLAGGGVRGGAIYGQSDEWGFRPADPSKAATGYDVHATMLHLLGIDHTRLTVRNNGIDRRLTDVHGHVIGDLLA